MARLADTILNRIREIEAELRTIIDGGPTALAMLAPALRELLAAEQSVTMVLGPRGDGLQVDHGFSDGLGGAFIPTLNAYIEHKTVGWAMYNPVRPEPTQRNVALYWEPLRRLLGLSDRLQVPVARDLMPRFGLGSADNLRVLVCDGPSLLGWVGVFREGSFGSREQRTLQRLVPALQRRLLLERHIANAPSMRARLDATFAAIPMPAFLTDIAGTVLEANAAASLWLEREGREGRERLRDAVKRRRDLQFDVTSVVAAGSPELRLVLLRASADLTTPRAAQAAQRWGFTTQQARSLACSSKGSPRAPSLPRSVSPSGRSSCT
jgi:PAS domain-containing protein